MPDEKPATPVGPEELERLEAQRASVVKQWWWHSDAAAILNLPDEYVRTLLSALDALPDRQALLQAARERDSLAEMLRVVDTWLREHGGEAREALVHHETDGPFSEQDWTRRLAAIDALAAAFGVELE